MGGAVRNRNLWDNSYYHRFPVHRLVMGSSSHYFETLLAFDSIEDRESEVIISNIDGSTLNAIIKFCYSGKIQIIDKNIIQIIEAATAMGHVRIVEKCKQYWIDTLATSNCVETFVLADTYSFLDLRQKSLQMICDKFESVANTDLRKLESQYFYELLQCYEIHALEDFIFQRLVLWVDYDEENRAEHASNLLTLIRLEKITLQVFIRIIRFAILFNKKICENWRMHLVLNSVMY